MQNVQDNRAISANSEKWTGIRAFWQVVCEYVCDYLNGQKYKAILNQNNQKQK